MTMKRNLILMMVLVGIMGVLPGCKKGEEDPFISLLSRKGRICGDWVMNEGTTEYGTPVVEEIDYYSEGNKLTIQANQGNISGNYTWKFEINKDGSYRIYQRIDLPYNSPYTVDETGYWYFLSRNSNSGKKNKECIAFQPAIKEVDLIVYEYTASDPTIYEIVRLSNKQIKLKGVRTYKKTDDVSVTEINYEETLTLVPKKKM